MNLNVIKYNNSDWEEIITYYFLEKKVVNNEVLFIKEINKFLNCNFDLNNFKNSNIEIPIKELNTFFEDAKIIDIEILKKKSYEEDWNLIDTYLETKDYYIFRSWETTA